MVRVFNFKQRKDLKYKTRGNKWGNVGEKTHVLYHAFRHIGELHAKNRLNIETPENSLLKSPGIRNRGKHRSMLWELWCFWASI